MFRNEAEFQEAVRRLAEEAQRLCNHRDRLRETGLSDFEIQRALDPLEAFYLQKNEEIEAYKVDRRG